MIEGASEHQGFGYGPLAASGRIRGADSAELTTSTTTRGGVSRSSRRPTRGSGHVRRAGGGRPPTVGWPQRESATRELRPVEEISAKLSGLAERAARRYLDDLHLSAAQLRSLALASASRYKQSTKQSTRHDRAMDRRRRADATSSAANGSRRVSNSGRPRPRSKINAGSRELLLRGCLGSNPGTCLGRRSRLCPREAVLAVDLPYHSHTPGPAPSARCARDKRRRLRRARTWTPRAETSPGTCCQTPAKQQLRNRVDLRAGAGGAGPELETRREPLGRPRMVASARRLTVHCTIVSRACAWWTCLVPRCRGPGERTQLSGAQVKVVRLRAAAAARRVRTAWR